MTKSTASKTCEQIVVGLEDYFVKKAGKIKAGQNQIMRVTQGGFKAAKDGNPRDTVKGKKQVEQESESLKEALRRVRQEAIENLGESIGSEANKEIEKIVRCQEGVT